MNNEPPPVKHRYVVISNTRKVAVIAVSEAEARKLYELKYDDSIAAIVKGKALEYEYVV